MSVLPLSNLRVANFGWVWVAPLMGHILADMGAEVFKVETRNRPDVIRILPPYMDEELAKERGQQPLESLYAANTFRNYRGITLDISTGEGQRLAKDLIKSCDVVIENFSPKVMGKFGMGYEELRALRPDLIMISASAAGKDGPRSDLVSYGGVVSAMAGIDFNQGYPELGRPQAANTTIMDPLQGIYCAFAVLAAIRHRARTGEGQHIDFAQWEAAATIVGWADDGVGLQQAPFPALGQPRRDDGSPRRLPKQGRRQVGDHRRQDGGRVARLSAPRWSAPNSPRTTGSPTSTCGKSTTTPSTRSSRRGPRARRTSKSRGRCRRPVSPPSPRSTKKRSSTTGTTRPARTGSTLTTPSANRRSTGCRGS